MQNSQVMSDEDERRGPIVCLTTVHPRDDTRIFFKEATSLARDLTCGVWLMVADGKGSTHAGNGLVSIHDLGTLEGGRVRRALVGPRRAFSAIRRIRPEIVHFHDPELIPLAIFLKLLGYKVIYDVHEDVPRQILTKYWLHWMVRRPVAWLMTIVESCCGKIFDAIVPATSTIAERFPPSKTVLVQNYPIQTELKNASPIPHAERPKHFVYPGIIAAIRGGLEMVQAIELLDDIPDARLEICGSFSPDDFAEKLRNLPGWGLVTYHGWVSREQLETVLRNARAGLVVHHPVPNEIEAQPIKLYEYMSAGLPVIASDFPAWRSRIEACGCGLLVDPLDPREISEAMRWILDNPSEAEEMGRRGQEAIQQSYNWDVEEIKLFGLYKKILSS